MEGVYWPPDAEVPGEKHLKELLRRQSAGVFIAIHSSLEVYIARYSLLHRSRTFTLAN